jgi:hypothetical protein
MASLPIIIHFQVLKERASGLFMGGIDGIAHTFLFEGTEEVGWAPGEVHCSPFPNASLQTRRAVG